MDVTYCELFLNKWELMSGLISDSLHTIFIIFYFDWSISHFRIKTHNRIDVTEEEKIAYLCI